MGWKDGMEGWDGRMGSKRYLYIEELFVAFFFCSRPRCRMVLIGGRRVRVSAAGPERELLVADRLEHAIRSADTFKSPSETYIPGR